MQLISKLSLTGFMLALISMSYAQENLPIEVDFLMNYYGQDGDKSAVTGGKGSEELSNVGTKIIVNIPKNNNTSYAFSFNVDAYSSASSDAIDPVRTGASGSDLHAYATFDYTVEMPERQSAYTLSAGVSTEYDYRSFSFGGTWATNSIDKNRQFSVSTMNFIDFVTLIYPIELRNNGSLLKDDKRQTYSVSFNYNQVVNKHLQIALMSDLIYQKGLLSTPFNRVYFKDSPKVDVERLPDSRFKWPLGVRLNYFLSDQVVTRLHYRFYADDFGLTAHTISLETPLRLNQSWALIPFFRYHNQSEADYFGAFKTHSTTDNYYTSDYDLSGLSSTKGGLGIRYYPLETIGHIMGAAINRIDFRGGFYSRSDGLTAFNITAGISFNLP